MPVIKLRQCNDDLNKLNKISMMEREIKWVLEGVPILFFDYILFLRVYM